MILVDVQIPSLDKVYDFELDEEMKAGELTQKIAQMAAQKEGLVYEPEDKLYLYALRREEVLDERKTLRQQEIGAGERLILI